jgi:hypothetical protein
VAFRRGLQMRQFCTALDIGGGSDLLGQDDAAAGSCKAGNRRAWHSPSPVDATFTDVVENELLAGEMEAAGVPGVAGPLRVHLRLEFHDEGNGKTRLELRQGPFATGQLGADTRSGWESSFTKLDTLLRASLAPDLGTRRP